MFNIHTHTDTHAQLSTVYCIILFLNSCRYRGAAVNLREYLLAAAALRPAVRIVQASLIQFR